MEFTIIFKNKNNVPLSRWVVLSDFNTPFKIYESISVLQKKWYNKNSHMHLFVEDQIRNCAVYLELFSHFLFASLKFTFSNWFWRNFFLPLPLFWQSASVNASYSYPISLTFTIFDEFFKIFIMSEYWNEGWRRRPGEHFKPFRNFKMSNVFKDDKRT